MFGNLSKSIGPVISKALSQNKGQQSAIDGMMKSVSKILGDGNEGLVKQLKPLLGNLEKSARLIEAQNSVLEGMGQMKLDAGEDKNVQKLLDELMSEAQKIAAENDKQAAELDGLSKEVEKAGKEAKDDKDGAKKVKAATAALEKALKLLNEQNKALDELKKALA